MARRRTSRYIFRMLPIILLAVGALVSLNMLVAFGATVTCMFILLRKLYAGKSHVQEEHEPVL